MYVNIPLRHNFQAQGLSPPDSGLQRESVLACVIIYVSNVYLYTLNVDI